MQHKTVNRGGFEPLSCRGADLARDAILYLG